MNGKVIVWRKSDQTAAGIDGWFLHQVRGKDQPSDRTVFAILPTSRFQPSIVQWESPEAAFYHVKDAAANGSELRQKAMAFAGKSFLNEKVVFNRFQGNWLWRVTIPGEGDG